MASIKKITEVEVPITSSNPGTNPTFLMAAGGFLKGYKREWVLCAKSPVTTTQVQESGIFLVRTGGSGENGYVEDAPFQTVGWHTMICFISNPEAISGYQLYCAGNNLYFRNYTYGKKGGFRLIATTTSTTAESGGG